MIYFIPTPIGNTDDITLRALKLFKKLDYFLCENTGTFKKLLNIYEIDYEDKHFDVINSFVSSHKMEKYVSKFKEEDVGIVSEAGTPGLSDPGKSIIKKIWEHDLEFTILPGANALVPGVVSAGFNTAEFVYMGFLPKKRKRTKKLKRIVNSDRPVFIYESVYRVEKTLKELKELGFDGEVSMAREISKMYEQIECDHIDKILSMIENNEITVKGEFVLGLDSTS